MVYTYKWVPYPGIILVPNKQFLHLTDRGEEDTAYVQQM